MELYSGETKYSKSLSGTKENRETTEIKSRFSCKPLFKAMETQILASQYILPVTISTFQCTVLIKRRGKRRYCFTLALTLALDVDG
jgi:hypothetical protein